MTRYVFDNLDDGVLDYDFWYAYTYDDGGAMVGRTFDSAGDGTLDGVDVYTRDAEGRMLSSRSTVPSNPDYDMLQIWSYDADGNNISYSYQNSGMAGYSKSMTYDALGRMTELRYDRDPQGSVDFTNTITYTCP